MALFEPLFESLNDAGVRYVVVGGLAVVLHGHARMTVDVDLVVDLDERQALKAVDALVEMGLQPRVPVDPRGFADRATREGWVRDLFVTHPVPFEELWSRSVRFELERTTVQVASIPDLIHLKRLAGRPQDQADIEQLEAILEAKRERE